MKVSLYRDGKPMRARTPTRAALTDARNLGLLADGTTLDLWLLMVTNLRDAARHEPPPPPGEAMTVKARGMRDATGSLQAWLTSMGRAAAPAGCWDKWRHLGEVSRACSAAQPHQLSLGKSTMETFESLNRMADDIARENRNVFAEIKDRIQQLEQRPNAQFDSGTRGSRRTLGDLAYEALRKDADLLAKTRSMRVELKAAADAITTSSGRTVISGGVGAPQGGVLGLHNAMPQRGVGATSAVEYSRFTGTQGAAAQQAAEGDAKAAVRPDHTLVTQTAITIAGYTKMSRQALSDSGELKAAIDVTLQRSVLTALDVALVNGATGFTGIEGLATAYTSLVYTALPDAISEGVSTMQVAGFAPDVVALNPANWLAITVARGALNDHYLSGSYLGSLPAEMRGLRVVLSPSVDAGKALLLDSMHTELLICEGFAVEVAYSGSDFTSNLVTVLGETRVLPIFRTIGAARLITPKA